MRYVNYENLETAKEMIKVALDKKVDKEDGKGLSTNDYTNEEKLKLFNIEEEANKTIVDSELNLNSINPVKNKVISEALNTKADKTAVEEVLETKADKTYVDYSFATVNDLLGTKVDKEDGKGLSTNDYTNEEKEKLAKLDEKSNENIIEVIKQNGEVLEIIDKSVNIVVPKDTSDLTNNAGYQTEADVTDKISEAMENINTDDIDLSNYATKDEIPTKLSQLINDEKFLSSFTEEDPTVPDYVKHIAESDIDRWNNGACNIVVSATEPITGEDIWVQYSPNLFDKSTALETSRINGLGEYGQYENGVYASDFIEVESNEQYTIQNGAVKDHTIERWYNFYYDIDKNPISGFEIKAGTYTITTPENAYYMRFTIDERLIDKFQFEKGPTASEYSAYVKTIKILIKTGYGYKDLYDSSIVSSLLKQDKLTAGDNVTINDDYVISVDLSNKQDKLTPGNNIIIDENNVISSIGGGGEGGGLSYQVGDVIITSTNTDPTYTFGGSWKLIDKDFSLLNDSDTGDGTYFTKNENNVSDYGIYFVRTGKQIFLRLMFKNLASLTDSTLEIGTLLFNKLGFSQLYFSLYSHLGGTDGGNAIVQSSLIYNTGVINVQDIVHKTTASSSASVTVNSETYIEYILNIPMEYMLDDACNKFYWEKIA